MLTSRTLLVAALLLIGQLLNTSVFCQGAEPQYLSAVLSNTSKKNATYYRIAEGMDGDRYIGRTYTIDGKLKAEGRYADAELSIEDGEFTFYHKNGELESKGVYIMGFKSGVWERHDQWGRPLAEKVYDPEPLANIVYTRAQTMPKYRGGDDKELVHYIKERVVPTNGRKARGSVTASFIVEKNGELSDVKVVAGKSSDIDHQVVQAIRSTSPWEPGADKGQPVRVQVRLPVQF
ncbi:MAG: TonB family protein [Flavobacteriales bacterium]